MHIAADNVEKKALLNYRAGSIEREAAHPVADIENHAVLSRQQNFLANETAENRRVRKGPKTMGKDVATTDGDFLLCKKPSLSRAPKPAGPCSHAVVADGFVFVAGQGPQIPGTGAFGLPENNRSPRGANLDREQWALP
jgi:hypothetical protein